MFAATGRFILQRRYQVRGFSLSYLSSIFSDCQNATRDYRRGEANTRPRPSQAGNVECHLYATNVSVGLFRERRAYKIVFLQNTTATPFITGDQPIINLLDPHGTNDLELFYPLSPLLAMILSKDNTKFPTQSRHMTDLEIEHYNNAIHERS
jgi:hypothetical protein